MKAVTLAPPRAILFDWDTTLVDNWGAIAAAMNTVLAAMDMPPWTVEETIAQATLSARDRFPRLFKERAAEAHQIFIATLEKIHRDHIRPLPGAVESLETFKSRNLFVGIVSNKSSRFLNAEIDHLGWRGYFDAVVGASDAARDKPDPAPLLLCLSQARIAPSADTWFVGDTEVDVQTAKRAGAGAVFVRSNPLAPVWGDYRPDLEIDDLFQLQTLVIGGRDTI
jgi:phosphoglycolate phosphatase